MNYSQTLKIVTLRYKASSNKLCLQVQPLNCLTRLQNNVVSKDRTDILHYCFSNNLQLLSSI